MKTLNKNSYTCDNKLGQAIEQKEAINRGDLISKQRRKVVAQLSRALCWALLETIVCFQMLLSELLKHALRNPKPWNVICNPSLLSLVTPPQNRPAITPCAATLPTRRQPCPHTQPRRSAADTPPPSPRPATHSRFCCCGSFHNGHFLSPPKHIQRSRSPCRCGT